MSMTFLVLEVTFLRALEIRAYSKALCLETLNFSEPII